MLQILGGVLMMTGGGLLSAAGAIVARGPARGPIGPVGEALDRAYPPAGVPGDPLALLDRLP